MTTFRSDLPAAPARAVLAAVRYLVGVDGGGTGTRACVQLRAGGGAKGRGQAGPSALSQGVPQAWRHVQQAVAAAFADAGLAAAPAAECALGLGLAGAGVPAQRVAFLHADPGYACCVLENDGLTQLLGAHAGAPGLVVAAGTGSVAAALYADGRTRQAGGWGFPVGDEGSGAWLGLQAMRITHATLDGRVVPSALSQAIGAAAGSTAAELLAWCAAAPAQRYAELAPLVFAAAEQGDAAAQALLQAAADALAALVAALQAGHAPLPLVLRGGVGERLAPLWPPALQARLRPAAGDSADGALWLARQALGPAA
jgi:glucosamine kinase